jgi:hypothetical protein
MTNFADTRAAFGNLSQFSGSFAVLCGYLNARTTIHSGPSTPTNQIDGSTEGFPCHDISFFRSSPMVAQDLNGEQHRLSS